MRGHTNLPWALGPSQKFHHQIVNPDGDAELGNWFIAEFRWIEDAQTVLEAINRSPDPVLTAALKRIGELETMLEDVTKTLEVTVELDGCYEWIGGQGYGALAEQAQDARALLAALGKGETG